MAATRQSNPPARSIFLDTLKELFEGHELLFRGLYIHDCWDWSTAYPLIRLSFGGGVFLFSGLNNLNNITVAASYSTICVYIEADVDFAETIYY